METKNFPKAWEGTDVGGNESYGPVSKPRADKSDEVAVKSTGRLPLGRMDRM